MSINDIERRALIMAHPAFGAETTTTSTMLAAFTVLEPGDRARPHRHTGAAIRFATRADGAATIVNGRRCEMKEGDLILTPPMCWHGHINESDHRIIWFDAANMPLIRAVDAHFFEPGDPRNNEFWQVDEGDEKLWTESGLLAEGATASAVNSPKYRYPGEATRRLLASAPAGADGARMIRYVNPATGGAVMPTLDCYAARLSKGAPTRTKRATYNVICLVVAGEGRSTIGDADLRMVAARRVHHPALDLRAPRGQGRRRRPVHGHRQVGVRAARPGARGIAVTCATTRASALRCAGSRIGASCSGAETSSPTSSCPARSHCVLVRSPHAHARIRAIDVSAAAAAPGVVAVFTGADMAADGIQPDAAALDHPFA